MRQDARAERARQIEEAAYGVLEAKGYEGLSMQAVARTAGASNETLYRWYGDKAGLLEALIRRNSDFVRESLARNEASTPLDDLRTVGPVLLTMLLGPRAIALNRAAAADPGGPLGRALAREGRDAIAPRIVSVMDRAIADRTLSGATPEDMAETWFGLLIGDLQVRRVTGALAEPRPGYIEQRAAKALSLLRRLFPPGELDDTRQTDYP